MRRLILTCLNVLMLLALVNCSGARNTTSIPGPQNDAGVATMPAAGDVVAEKEGFALSVLDESFTWGGSAEFALRIRSDDAATEVSVLATADGLRSALLALSYPAGELQPVDSALGAWPGLAEDELLSLTVLDDPGTVHLGTVVTRPQEHAGVSGEFSVLTVRFAPRAGELPARRVSTPPDLMASAIPDLQVDFATGDVTFSYVSLGDYNQNSLVEVADITPIGVHWAEESPDFPTPFPFDSIGSVVDGNSNGLIEVADITPIGQNFDKFTDHWELYGGDKVDYPPVTDEDNGAAALLGTIAFPAATVTDARLVVSENVPGAMGFAGEGCWLRPADGDGTEGIPSNLFEVPGPTDTDAPVWDFVPDGEGVIEVIPLDGGLRVLWGSATDASDFNYLGWVQEGAVDYGAEPDFSIPPSDPPDPPTDQITEIMGLTNGTEYTIAVRARDVFENETANTNTLTGTPLAEAEVPMAVSSNPDFMGPMKISSGNPVLVTGEECIHFWGDFVIEEGAKLEGRVDGLCIIVHGNFTCNGTIELDLPDTWPVEDAPSMKLVLMGDVNFGENSVVTGNGNIYIVDDPDEIVDPQDVEDELEAPSDPADFPFQLDYEQGAPPAGKQGSTAVKTASSTTYYGPRPWTQWLVQGNWGKVPVQPAGVTRVVLRIWPVNGQLQFQNFSISGPDGRPGNDATGCTAIAGDGQDNKWRFRIHTGRTLNFNNVNIKLGDGGRGGNATTPQDCDPGVAVGGDGGNALNKFRFTAGQSINITGTFSFNPGNGGAGGTADAWGKNGEDGCPAEDGADAFATGGNGGDVPRWGVRTRGAVNGTGNVSLGIAEGGVGGQATAWGGSGGNDTCLPGAVGGSGGLAEGTGGDGGDSTFSDGGSGAAGGGATGGDGGMGRAAGGQGGDGASWWKIPGGDGGAGGPGTAVGGEGGEATGDGTLTQGNRGAAEAIGGNGGNGGDGLPPGVGGDGGLASADGNPATELDGEKGLDGNPSPLFLSEHIIIIVPTLPDGPILPGDYVFPLFDRLTEEVVGGITVTLDPGAFGQFFVTDYGPAGPRVLEMSGDAALLISKSMAVYDDPADLAPWVGVEYTHYNTVGDVGVGYWYSHVPLDDYAVPENISGEPQTDTFMVDPGLFYENFAPDPELPPQWDDCAIYCNSAATEIIEIVIIDP